MIPQISLKHAVAYLVCSNPDMTALQLHAHLAEIGIEVSLHTVTAIRADYRRTVRAVEELEAELEPKPKQKRLRPRTWYPDG